MATSTLFLFAGDAMKTSVSLITIFLLLFTTVAAALVFYPMGFLYATYENLYGEWLQFSAFMGIAVFGTLIVVRRRVERRWFWGLLAIAAFYVAMEEISWGQQIFGWESSAFFQKKNLQGETNLHNMFTGPYSTITKDLLTYVLALGMLGFGVIYPLLVKFNFGIAKFAERMGVPVPPLSLMPFFIVAAYCEMSFHHFNEAEIAELFVALAMMFLGAVVYFRGANASDRQIGVYCLMIFGAVLVSSFALTQNSIHSDFSKRRVANRIEAGVKKFAGRYERIGQYGHAIDLYKRHLAYDPESRSRMRRLATTYKAAGRFEDQQAQLQKALQLDLKQLEKEAWRASLHRSLYRTYKDMGNLTDAQKHINEAYSINQARLKEHPDSAAAEYSLARTLDLLGRRKEAVGHYKRAFDLKPKSSKYRRAYRDATD